MLSKLQILSLRQQSLQFHDNVSETAVGPALRTEYMSYGSVCTISKFTFSAFQYSTLTQIYFFYKHMVKENHSLLVLSTVLHSA
jgi:hypothetical protein